MPRFLAIYTMKSKGVARFRSLPKPEQNATDAVGFQQWADWEERNAAFFPDRGSTVGRTTRYKDCIADAVTPFCDYIVVEADTIDASAACSTTTRASQSSRAAAWTSCPSSPPLRRLEHPPIAC